MGLSKSKSFNLQKPCVLVVVETKGCSCNNMAPFNGLRVSMCNACNDCAFTFHERNNPINNKVDFIVC